MRKAEHKPLSFSTTMRNPERIAGFLNVIKEFDKKELTEEVIMKIMSKTIKQKYYKPVYINRVKELKDIHKTEDAFFTDDQVEEIIINSPQNHKEAGFPKGWPSRFDTYYKLMKEFGFVYYEMNKPIELSNTGYMLCDAYVEGKTNEEDDSSSEKLQSIYLNALAKYQTDNPFRKNANSNAPIPLLLNVLKLLKSDETETDAGIYIKELSFLICWPNSDHYKLYDFIKKFRQKHRFSASDEIFYEECLTLLQSDNQKRFKMSKILYEAVDDLIRKLRITGLFSLRGMGRFIDLNSIENEKIKYIIDNYSNYQKFTDQYKFFEYMGNIDANIVNKSKTKSVIDIKRVRHEALKDFANKFSVDIIKKELVSLCKQKPAKDEYLKLIDGPTRLEFLTSIYLTQNFPDYDVQPNYNVDDEGNPTFTAKGNTADIIMSSSKLDSTIEVTLMKNRSQSTNEIPAITRHLRELRKLSKKEHVFCIFVAPNIHEDTIYMCEFTASRHNLDIYPYDIKTFTERVAESESVYDLTKNNLLLNNI